MAEMQAHRIRVVVTAFLLTGGLCAQTATRAASSLRDDSRVTPVSGESWLVRLNRSFGDSSMGKTGRLGPGPHEDAGTQQTQGPIFSSRDGVFLHGSDLYRLNCQGCHGESGQGAPPEINSVINPVRATSVPLVLARMKSTGMDISYADASKLAQQSKAALLERLHKGGENMPAFPQLSDAEITALLAYLAHLADVPGAGGDQSVIKESHARVGELIVKSTCHTCHSALGADPGPQDLMNGSIPPLSSLTTRKNPSDFVRKVTQGAPVRMGTPPMLCRGRMPVFFYLSDGEAADVYLYLSLYPPAHETKGNPLVAASLGVRPPSGGGPSAPPPVPIGSDQVVQDANSTADAEVEKAAVSMTAIMVGVALLGGLVFTLREFKRLSSESTGRAVTAENVHIDHQVSGGAQMFYRTAAPLLYSEVKRSPQ
jgi:mono/diheme cytochrome c family protein